jgi:hypothetical protein
MNGKKHEAEFSNAQSQSPPSNMKQRLREESKVIVSYQTFFFIFSFHSFQVN